MNLRTVTLAVLLTGCASAPVQKTSTGATPEDGSYALRIAEGEAVLFQGVVSFDGAGLDSRPGMLYGPGAVGFVAALVAHGTILKGVRERQKTKIQTEADKVLAPYASILATFRQEQLVDGALASGSSPHAHLVRPAAGAGAAWHIDSTPVFSMTQDQQAIVLDHIISITRADSTTPIYQNNIQIVSSANLSADPVSYWGANSGERLKGESVRLYRESLALALRDAAGTAPAGESQDSTVRYHEGRLERTERAQVLEKTCDRAVIRTLRGWLMSVPLAEPADSCVVQLTQ